MIGHHKGEILTSHDIQIKRSLNTLLLPVLPLIVGQDDAELWRDLLAQCRTFIEGHTDPRVQRIVLLDARAVLTWNGWHTIEREYGVVLLRGYLRRAIRRRIIQPLPLHALAMILTGALNEACVLVANAPDRTSALNEASAIIERLLEGLRLRSPTELDGTLRHEKRLRGR